METRGRSLQATLPVLGKPASNHSMDDDSEHINIEWEAVAGDTIHLRCAIPQSPAYITKRATSKITRREVSVLHHKQKRVTMIWTY